MPRRCQACPHFEGSLFYKALSNDLLCMSILISSPQSLSIPYCKTEKEWQIEVYFDFSCRKMKEDTDVDKDDEEAVTAHNLYSDSKPWVPEPEFL